MTRIFRNILLLPLFILVGCANPVNMYTAQRYHNAGVVAERRGDYKLAHHNFYRAYVNTEIGFANPRKRALTMYNLGRMKGYLCLKAEAERLLKKSLEIEGKETNKSGDWYLGRLMELGKFYYDFKEYGKSLPYFKAGVGLALEKGLDKKYPIQFSGILKRYGESLKKTGRLKESKKILTRHANLKLARKNSREIFNVVRYNQSCKRKS